jgi:hypothetical protein
MKIILTLVVLVLLAVAAINGAVYFKYGKVPFHDWMQSAQQDGLIVATTGLIPVYKDLFDRTINSKSQATSKSVKVYKWKDENGVIHYDNRAVAGSEAMDIDPNVNFMPPAATVTLPDSEEAKPKAKTMEEETQAILDKKRAYMESLTQ